MPADLDHPSAADEVFCLADVRVSFPDTSPEKHPLPKSGVNAYISTHGPSLWIPFTDGRYRIVGQILSGEAPKEPSKEYLERMLESRYPSRGVKIEEVLWSSRFFVRFRLAEKYWEEHVPGTQVQAVGKKGGLAVVGDAAHVHSPMGEPSFWLVSKTKADGEPGGQGMNLGIRDSIYLGSVLSHCLSPTFSAQQARDLLTRWSTDRHAAGARVIRLAGGITFFGANAAGYVGCLRDWAMWIFGRVPGVGGWAMYMVSGLGEKSAEY
jgi:2-polyprenyl-6-methoxyphenol hydroxylase-like FAD-dependent oxidoreductase